MSMIRLVLSVLLIGVAGCRQEAPPPAVTVASPEALRAHSAEFEQGVFEVTDGVHVAIGFGIANSILLEGDDGVIIVDTMETAESAQAVLAAFREITDKPVKALIYTHSHPDHIGGARVFAEGNDAIPVYAHRDVVRNMEKTSIELQTAITRRSLRMYGSYLPEDEHINVGLGPRVDIHDGSTISVMRPTQEFDDRLEQTVAGIRFELVHAPGETEDQLFVWLPDRRILLPGDNIYKAFPNLYTIRGTAYRDPRQWADSIDAMRALGAEYLVPSHTRPVVGAARIDALLTEYRDGIRYVYDQTLRMINQGLTPDEIAARIRLPAHLADADYLAQFYGKPTWSARSVFAGNLGWYDGNPSTLQPLPPDDEAARWAELAGGLDALAQQVVDAQAAGEHQWALQLSDHVLRLQPQHAAVREARIRALRALGEVEANPNARNWYLMAARELAGEFTLPQRILTPTPEMLAQMPLARFFDGMAVNLDAEAAAETVTAVGFEFTDSDERYTYIVRRGASEVVPVLRDDADIVVRVSAQAFKEMLAQLRNPALSLVRDFEVTQGSKLGFARFMRLFQSAETAS
ncbi:alkyl sulfatase dimerization domain-containing protein [Sinimarinibacterium flocculans]|uniref:Alkyl sulfatase BDS1-like metallo-beta-lactamase superfamily hydrolase n=1 Tax=Sinimarinibacterium flocculans TaxID=985250 RepID=A0A318EHC5_9GAMM|nr:alkyl sulfatase dimerization domain-containing protein [Sinimarinibacterium flocculans]PXV67856.1 alkyl sulfatase BDS1-like metallo-beta-lactamase superfamily hydrolase [Sinimarinibacterium flocculans]